jgi:hypothetical protein
VTQERPTRVVSCALRIRLVFAFVRLASCGHSGQAKFDVEDVSNRPSLVSLKCLQAVDHTCLRFTSTCHLEVTYHGVRTAVTITK